MSTEDNKRRVVYTVDKGGSINFGTDLPNSRFLPDPELNIHPNPTRTDTLATDKPVITEESEELRQLKSYANNAKRLIRFTAKTRDLAWKTLLDIELPQPGLIPLHEGVYTGWFKIFNKGVVESVRPYVGADTDSFKRMYLLSPDEFQHWNDLMSTRALQPSEADNFRRISPTETHSKWYRVIRGYPIDRYVSDATTFLQEFWDKAEQIRNSGYKTPLADHLRDHLLILSIMAVMQRPMNNHVNSKFADHMQRYNKGVLELDQDEHLVLMQRANGFIGSRRIQMGASQAKFFNRNLKSGERPFTKAELKVLGTRHGLAANNSF